MKIDFRKISPVTWFTGLYFALMAFDCFSIGSLGSLLRIFAILPLLLLIFEYKNLRITVTPATGLQLCFWLLALISLFYTIDISTTEKSVLTLTFNLALVLCLGTMKKYNDSEVEFLKTALIAGSWIALILMLAFSNISEGRLTLKLGESAQDANYMNGYLLFAFVYHTNEFIKKKKLLHLLAVAFLIIIVILTGSRGAILAFGLVVFVRICVYLREESGALKKWVYAAAIIVLAFVIFDAAMLLLPESLTYRFRWEYLTSAKGTTGRFEIWKTLLSHYSHDNLGRVMFGHGYGTTKLVNTLNSKVAHNLYLDNLISLGMIGCALQILIQIAYIVMLVRSKDRMFVYVLIGIIGMCISLSLTSYRPLWNLMTIALIISNNYKSNRQELEIKTN